MTIHLDPPLTPRDRRRLLVLIVARISTIHQDRKSLDDQVALCERWLRDHTDLPFETHNIASRGSGECLDRRESAEAIQAVESNRFDLVLTEDLGRIYRRIEALLFCENCIDFATRLVAINDHVDTAQANWKLGAFFGVMRHEAYNDDGAARIRRTLRNRFSQGGVIITLPYGYEKPEGCKHDSEIRKLPGAAEVYDRWFTMLEEGAGFAEVADWLNQGGVPTGKHCRSGRWTSFMVGRITTNWILKGVRLRNRRKSKRFNKTGRHRSVAASPEELLARDCPHLAFIDPERFDRVNRIVAERNRKYRRNGRGAGDPRRGLVKRRTPWPAQHVLCGVCDRLYYRGGHGQVDRLMCSGSREHKCWNGATFNGPEAATRLAGSILAEIEALPEFEETLLDDLRRQLDARGSDRRARLHELDGRQRTFERAKANLLMAVRESGPNPILMEELARLDLEQSSLDAERSGLERFDNATFVLPSTDRIKAEARTAFADLALESPDFGRLMRRLVRDFVVKPYQLIDGGKVVLRAHLTLDLTTLVEPKARGGGFGDLLERDLIVDLFAPPQRVLHRAEVAELTSRRVKQREIATVLGITQPAVQHAIALQRMMDVAGVVDPYRLLTEPPSGSGRLRRQHHARYRFEPLDRSPVT